MESISFDPLSPASCSPDRVPAVGDVRPARCPACGVPARRGDRLILHGHGVRTRWVVVPPALGTIPAARQLVECWQRRYRCSACGAVAVVLPRGLLPRFLYTVAAIVLAILFVAEPPVGEGLSDAVAYARQGLFAQLSTYAEEPYRWRSLDRWAARAADWWSGWSGDLAALLLLFIERAGSPDRADILKVAVAHHVRWAAAR